MGKRAQTPPWRRTFGVDGSRNNRIKVVECLAENSNHLIPFRKSQIRLSRPSMPSDTKETEHQPFLKYSDDPMIDEPEPGRQYHHVEGRRTMLLSHSLVFIITSLLWTMVFFTISPTSIHWGSPSKVEDHHNITSNARLVTCGNSTQEARALGCKYDVLLNNWVPAQCVDKEFVQEYQDDRSWGAFADENLTQKLTTIDEMSERETYYTSVRDHINHCALIWKKQFWALYEESPAFDTVISTPYHTDTVLSI